MIFDNIKNAGHYRGLPAIYKALCQLATWQAEGFPLERVELEGEDIFANPVSLTTKPVEDCLYEAHRKFIDLHFTVSGVEGISTRQVDELAPHGEFDAGKDIGFYTGEASTTCYVKPGEFMVCWPEDAHRVAMMADAPAPVHKMVVKIRV